MCLKAVARNTGTPLYEGFNCRMVTLIQDDPLFDSIRDEPEFQQIVLDVKAKYLKDFNATRAWLFEQGLL